MEKCKLCGGKFSPNNIRLGICWECASLQSVLVDGTDMYDKKILDNFSLPTGTANNIIKYLAKSGWYNINIYKQNKLESLSPFPKWRYNWFVIPFYRLAIWIQVFLWKKGIHTHNIISKECTPDFSCCKNKIKNAGMTHIMDAIVDAAKEDENIVTIKKVDNPN